MERRSKKIDLTQGEEIIIPSEGGYLKYPTDAVLTAQVGGLDGNGSFSIQSKLLYILRLLSL
jgi:hypothetical protein